jgi:uncharacterized protein (DUF1800 family)
MPVSLQQKNQHLLWRAGFGIDTKNIESISTLKSKEIFSQLELSSKTAPEYYDFVDASIKDIYAEMKDLTMIQGNMKNGLDFEQRKKLRQQSNQDIKKLNLKWLEDMVNGDAPFREKMALFWHGHFACREQNIFYQQELLHQIRTNALGNFGDLLKAVSKSASILSFLNNQQNKKQHPNENFAREVMELFTLGRGNYTEDDIKEAARSFTGWGFTPTGEFIFKKNQHDDGNKTIFGKSGNFNGDDVLIILLEQKQTARYITQKIYKYFVNDEVDTTRVDWLSNRFYSNNYNIAALMKDIFTSTWFYDDKNIGAKIKSPVELLVGIRKQLTMQLDNPEIQLLFEKALGQWLFYPPNVAGWAGGKNWIDSSSLMLRLQIPHLIKDDTEFTLATKVDDDQQMGMKEMLSKKEGKQLGGQFKINAHINWVDYIKKFDGVNRENLFEALKQITLQSSTSINPLVVENNIDKSSRENYIKSATIALMSTPEYQLM